MGKAQFFLFVVDNYRPAQFLLGFYLIQFTLGNMNILSSCIQHVVTLMGYSSCYKSMQDTYGSRFRHNRDSMSLVLHNIHNCFRQCVHKSKYFSS